ncbi:hypothetical protein H257_16618 [Aphanomyces astaci]|uniref:Uncharacterized protein n=1 Tax=Aphanomyces astaci TaxID=112090 RepID=W4FJQ9_APHAT|nr:hypothetical protein H257_16618 [Aphanomyces astaci]ETV67049.1 hypothetical protein H257_16618 [Aphanomyces astaci]|eukprot:XP_009843418.1 hypothetical protein H257_16618 [Aphanomyces astaci]
MQNVSAAPSISTTMGLRPSSHALSCPSSNDLDEVVVVGGPATTDFGTRSGVYVNGTTTCPLILAWHFNSPVTVTVQYDPNGKPSCGGGHGPWGSSRLQWNALSTQNLPPSAPSTSTDVSPSLHPVKSPDSNPGVLDGVVVGGP